VQRHGSTVRVSWAGDGSSYDVELSTSAGLDLRQRTTTTSATFTQIERDFSGVVSVRPISSAMVAGNIERATLAGGPQVEVGTTRLTVTPKRAVSVPVTCHGGACRAVLELVMQGTKGPVRAATGTVRLATGHASVVTLHLTKKAEELLGTHASVSATLVVSTGDSTPLTRQVRLLHR
jgi:hypothetical protein